MCQTTMVPAQIYNSRLAASSAPPQVGDAAAVVHKAVIGGRREHAEAEARRGMHCRLSPSINSRLDVVSVCWKRVCSRSLEGVRDWQRERDHGHSEWCQTSQFSKQQVDTGCKQCDDDGRIAVVDPVE
jgi:hypothetical protein